MKGILWAVIQSEVNVPRLYPCGQPHHVTLRYGVYRSRWRWLEGLRFTAIAHKVAHNERVQAIAVSLPWWIRWVCQNAHPHITMSWVEKAEPVESNEMLVRPLQVELVRFQVQCQIQFKPFEK